MRKRLVLIFCLLITSIFGFVGCADDPYASMRLECISDELTTDQVNNLCVTKSLTGEYEYDQIEFQVKVSGVGGDVSDGIEVIGGDGYIYKPTVEYLGGGVSKISVIPLPIGDGNGKTGDFTLKVRSLEGEKSLSLDFRIVVTLNDFELNSNKLQAVTNDYSVVLDNLDGFIVPSPVESNQLDFEYSIAYPDADGNIENVDDVFTLPDSYKTYRESGYKYADIITNPTTKESTLVVYPYWRTASGELAKDSSGNSIPTEFPQLQMDYVGQESVSHDYITLKVSSLAGTADNYIPDEYLNIRVVPNPGDCVVQMNTSDNSDKFEINADKNGIYNVVLINANNNGNIQYGDSNAYLSSRDLFFSIKNPIESNGILSEYVLQTKDLTSLGSPVAIHPFAGEDNAVAVSTEPIDKSEIEYIQTFVMANKDYPDLFTKEIKVRFRVINIPSNVAIKCSSPATVYDIYPRDSYGTKIEVDTNSRFGYYVVIDDTNSKVASSLAILGSNGDSRVMGIKTSDGILDEKTISTFSSSSIFYLKLNLKENEELPTKDAVNIYVAISFSLADSSYSQNIVDEYFGNQNIMYTPISLQFAKGVGAINMTRSSYDINISNSDYLYQENTYGDIVDPEDGIKLFDLPADVSAEETIKSIEYDTTFLKVYPYLDGSAVSYYVKYLDTASADQTSNIVFTAYNGLVASTKVSTYIPTVYKDDDTDMPLACDVKELSSGFLYYMTGADDNDHKKMYELELNGIDKDYNSIKRLFLIINQKQVINFYDYRVVEVDGQREIESVNVTSKIRVQFAGPNDDQYAEYADGVITTYSNVTMDYTKPIRMIFSYDTGYEDFDEIGSIRTPITISHTIELFIYEPLEGVEIKTSKDVELYVNESLGYYNKDLATHTIESTFIPKKVELGADWNKEELWGTGLSWTPVELKYIYESALDSAVLSSSKKAISIVSNNGGSSYLLKYSDLFEIESIEDKYSCRVDCKIGEDLTNWFGKNGYNTPEQIDGVLQEIFKQEIELVVYVNIQQFNKLVNINSVKFTAKYAERISELKLDIDDDGVYFEKRGEKTSPESISISYSINSGNIVNKNIRLTHNYSSFEASESHDSTGNGGLITITPFEAGNELLTVTPEDNIKSITRDSVTGKDVIVYYNQSLVQTFRIKVADGTKQYPFEIRNMSDYLQMIEDIESGNYYHYVITRDLNFSGYSDRCTNIDIFNSSASGKEFVLSGKHTYQRNGETIVTFSSIYNLAITRDVTGDENIGLFGKLGNFVTLDNINISDAKITVKDNLKNSEKTINVGILVGESQAKITACSVSGDIKIVRNEDNDNTFVVGGMVGSGNRDTIKNLPDRLEYGIVSTSNNSYVDIELTRKNNTIISSIDHNIIGGLIGKISNTTIDNVQAVVNINSSVRSTIGGIVGLVEGEGTSNVHNVYAVPSINANVDAETDSPTYALDIGGVIGRADARYSVENAVINFLNVSSSTTVAEQKTNMWISASENNKVYVGGLVGRENGNYVRSISKSYVRSFYSEDITQLYWGNIFVNASSGAVGGLVGCVGENSIITTSYFDGDITASAILNVGMLVGDMSSLTMSNCYAMGRMYTASFADNTFTLGRVSDINNSQNFGIIGGRVSYSQNNDSKEIDDNAYMYAYDKLTAVSVYAVVNGNINYFLKGKNVFAINSLGSDNNPVVFKKNSEIFQFFKAMTYAITDGEKDGDTDFNIDNYTWFWYSTINTVVVGSNTVAYPMLLVDGNVMYDLVPREISVKINEHTGIYDISYVSDGTSLVQAIMYLNDNSYYEISLNKQKVAFEIKLNGTTISTTYITSNNLKLYDKIEILESSEESVVRISGNRVYPVSTGNVVLTIRSYAVHSVKVEINILVVYGMDDIEVVLNGTKMDADDSGNVLDGIDNENKNIVYIDEQSNMIVSAINNSNSQANANYGFVLELMDAEGDGVVNGIIKIGNREYTYTADGNNILIFNEKTLQLNGVQLGRVKFKITPYLILTGVQYTDTYYYNESSSEELENAYLLKNLAKTYNIDVRARASKILSKPTEISLNTKGDVSFSLDIQTANVIVADGYATLYEDLMIGVGNTLETIELTGVEGVWTGNKCTISLDSDDYYIYSHELISVIFTDIVITRVQQNILKDYTYTITLSGMVHFNKDEYRKNADKYDINSVEYAFVMKPESNKAIIATTTINIAPKNLTEIFTNFYSKISHTDSIYNEFPEDNESQFIVPGREGLLKITLDNEINNGEFNNSSYVIVTLDSSYLGMVTLQQLSAIVDSEGDSGEILAYSDVISSETISGKDYFGIRLSKLSINYQDNNYFNNTYYVKITVRSSIDTDEFAGKLNLNITSYTRRDGVYEEQLIKPFSLDIMDLPHIGATVENETDIVMGKGVQKELNISFKGISDNIDFSISAVDASGNKINSADSLLYITNEDGEKVSQLDLEYLKENKKYYINQDVFAISGTRFTVDFVSRETILGIIEESKCSLAVTTVGFEIASVEVCDTQDNGILYLKYGENKRLTIKITVRDMIVGDESEIESYRNGELDNLLKIACYEIAGTKHLEYANGVESVISTGHLSLWYRDNSISALDSYIKISGEGSYYNISLIKKDTKKDNVFEEYYEIVGSSIGNDTYLQLPIQYYYDTNGNLCVGESIYSAVYIDGYTMNFRVVVEDNSTYDHPTPIEDASQLKDACSVEKGNYILVNNITLTDWAPVEAEFATLDGNGYTITIESFDLSAFNGVSSADVGIFTTISENTMLKNIIVDISPLLISKQTMLNNVEIMRASSKSTYKYNTGNIDLGYIDSLNFGIIAGTNNGSITNAKIISTKDPSSGSATSEELKNEYLHILTTQGEVDGSAIVSNLGGIAGVNNGAITNSFVGVNVSNSKTTSEKTSYYIETVVSPSQIRLDNRTDTLELKEIYPFVLAGGNNLGGLVCYNEGTISNSYSKGLGIYNTNRTVLSSATGGLVTYNNSTITSSFVEGNEISNYRAVKNTYRLESTGYIGGLVYENNATITNSYTNAYVMTNTSCLGGFVFRNNESGYISNCYSTAVNGNSRAVGQFTGVQKDKLQNFGKYENCYYMTMNGEIANVNEDAIDIDNSSNPYDNFTSWSGFSFITGANADGIWMVSDGNAPKIATTLTDTVSFRTIYNETTSEDSGNGIVYDYLYDTYYLGSKENPLIIEKAENFDKYIIDNAHDYKIGSTTAKVFGYGNDESANRYVRLVNNLDFSDVVFASGYNGTNLYSVTFAGVLDGNGMNLSNLNLNTKVAESGLDNFGLFGCIGYAGSSAKAVIKNVNLSVESFSATGNTRTGVLAGTIVNASIVNVSIDGGYESGNVIDGANLAGGLSGLIYADEKSSVSIIDVNISNISIHSSYAGFTGAISEASDAFYTKFKTIEDGQQSNKTVSFGSLYSDEKTNLGNCGSVSYAGGVAGAIVANNYTTALSNTSDYSEYRTKSNESTISNVTVSGSVVVDAEYNAGGLFGYIGENTLVRNSSLVVSDGQLLKGANFVGGIVGENHGVIEQCTVSYTTDITESDNQSEYDSTILSNDRENGTFNLFDMTSGTEYVTVAIGGIAGYSENGIILDSYVKANVVKSSSFIAGGILGYSKGYNYIGYVYNTGAVYANKIVGGVVGLQVNNRVEDTIADRLYMTNVVSLTNWNASSDTLNIRNEITSKLHGNQSIMYDSTDTLFYIKMPEVGNAPAMEMGKDAEGNVSFSENGKYLAATKSAYIGSVVGKALVNNNDSVYNGRTSSTHHILTNDLIGSLYSEENNISGVFSATLGLVSTSGDVVSGDRVDDYFTTDFTVDGGDDNQIKSLSYRVAYANSSLNAYEFADETAKWQDKLQYNQVFTSQEYIQQLLGVSYTRLLDDGSEGYNYTKTSRNIFSFGYNSDRSNVAEGTSQAGKFIDNNAQIWEVSLDTEVKDKYYYLPKFANGVVSSRVEITSADQLKSAFLNSSTGKTYVIKNDINGIEFDNANVQYYGGIKSVFVGSKQNSGENPKITIGANTAIFNQLNGAIFQDIDFVINIATNGDTGSEAVDEDNFGYFVNTLDGVQIINCNFQINIEKDGGDTSAIEVTPTNDFFATNIGGLFGAINNSNINNSNFKIVFNNGISLNDDIENFGLLAGTISRSTLSDVSITCKIGKVSIGVDDTVGIGGISGNVYNSKFTDVTFDYIGENFTIQGNNQYDKSIGNLFGSSNQLNLNRITLNPSNTQDTIQYIESMNMTHGESVNIGLIVGESSATQINNIITSATNNTNIVVAGNNKTISNLNVGSVIGKDGKDGSNVGITQIGKSGVVGSYADITIESISAGAMRIGGLVGHSACSNGLIINNAFYDGKISATNIDSNNQTTGTSYIGGLVGYADGKIDMTAVMSGARISLDIKEPSEISAIGGIIGSSTSTTTIDEFASIGTLSISDVDYTCMSGILGHNTGVLKATNGYSYVQLPSDQENTMCYSISDGTLSGVENVFYAQEFIGNNRDSDISFKSFAMADLYYDIDDNAHVSKYSEIYKALNSIMSVEHIGDMGMYIPISLAGNNYFTRTGTGDKFHPNMGISNISTENSYNVILNSIDNFSIGANIGGNAIVSGRSIESGNVVLSVNNNTASAISYLFGKNEGILSNVYVCVTGKDDNGVNKFVLMNTNEGLITNVMVYGVTGANYAFATENKGYIYSSVSSIKYSKGENDDSELYGFVLNNSGMISDCYSSSFAFNDNTNNYPSQISVYGFVKNNNHGAIQYSAYSIDSLMSSDNIAMGFYNANVSTGGTCTSCFESDSPSALLARSNVFTLENGHLQVVGMKDADDFIGIRINLKIGGNDATAITDVSDLKEKLTAILGTGKDYELTYEYVFYAERPTYDVVRISSGEMFIDYIASLQNSTNNGYIPANTIVLITDDLKVSASKFNSISLNASSAIIGIRSSTDSTSTSVIELDFGIYDEKTEILSSKGIVEHELIMSNYGMLIGLKLTNFKINQNNRNNNFAPIYRNTGLISNVTFDSFAVSGSNAEFVAGVVAFCEDGMIHNVTVSNCSITTYKYYNFLCTTKPSVDIVEEKWSYNIDHEKNVGSGNRYSSGV